MQSALLSWKWNRLWALPLVVVMVACDQPVEPENQPASPDAPVLNTTTATIAQSAERIMAGQVVARLVDGADDQVVATRHGVQIDHRAAGRAFTVFRGVAGNERALAARMGSDAEIVWAEPNYLRQTTSIDPKLWAFYNPGGLTIAFTRGRNKGDPVGSLVSVNDADMDNVNTYGAGGTQVRIASLDTGVEFSHGEFPNGQLIAGWDYIGNDGDPSDGDDHGTHTTGTMVGQSVGVAGVSGASTNVQVVVFRVCGAQGCPLSAIAQAIRAAADSGVVAMNLSLSGSSESQGEKDAIAYATGLGALVIASAGNGGTSRVGCPACDPLAISVAASDWLDELAYYSNWGTGLDITAPGGELYSNTTAEMGIWSSVRGNGYAYFQGTSMAAPQVTGTAGVVSSMSNGLKGAALRARLESTTDVIAGQPFGNGRLNSYRAVTGWTLDESGNQAPTSSFASSCPDLTCVFTDQSSDDGTIVDWSWTFQGGGTSSAQNPSHTFASAGTYTVTLTVTDDDGATDDSSQNVTVSVPVNQAPTASFTSSCPGLTCAFTDQSSDADGTIVDWSWTFGDGVTSSVQNPSHTYLAGTYTVTLTVTDNDGATGISSQSVTAAPPPSIALTAVGSKNKGRHVIDLSWTGNSGNVDIWRDGTNVEPNFAGTSYHDETGNRGGRTYTYQVCQTDTNICSAVVSVVF